MSSPVVDKFKQKELELSEKKKRARVNLNFNIIPKKINQLNQLNSSQIS